MLTSHPHSHAGRARHALILIPARPTLEEFELTILLYRLGVRDARGEGGTSMCSKRTTACLLFIVLPAAAQQLRDLGNLGSEIGGSDAVAINASGQVAGSSYPSGGPYIHAFLWTKGATDGVLSNPQMKDLGTLGGTYSYTVAISDRGQVAGVSSLIGVFGRHPFLWTPGGTDGVAGNPQMKDLADGQPLYVPYIVTGMNSTGQVVGYSGDPALGTERAFLWTPGASDGIPGNPQMKNLGTPLGGASNSLAVAINRGGQVSGVAWTVDAPSYSHAFLWTPGGTDGVVGNPQMKDLGTLGGGAAQASSMNAGGQVAGRSALPGNTSSHAFLWTLGAKDGVPGNPQMKDLGTIVGDSEARAINDAGQVAGNAILSADISHGFLWRPGGAGGLPGNPQMTDLDAVGDTYNSSAAVNTKGQVVGWALLAGNAAPHAFLWTPGGTDGVAGNPQMKDLGTLRISDRQSGPSTSQAWAINDNGQVVGNSNGRAFLYDPAGLDKTPPIISGMTAPGCSLWPPNHKLVQVADVKASDAQSGLAPGSLKVIGVSNELSDTGEPDIVITADGSGGFLVQLRADRLGTGNGRVYTINATAMDNAGNSATATSVCTVPHDQGH